MATPSNLKKVLGFWDVLGIAVGSIIGAGIMSLTGVAIGITGSGVPLVLLVGACFTLTTLIPLGFLGAAAPTTGGFYRYTSRLLSPQVGVFYILIYLLSKVTVAMYVLSFVQYLQGIFPAAPVKISAVLALTFVFLLNLFGIKLMAIIQSLMVLILFAALLAFIFVGFPQVDFSVFNREQMFPRGLSGFLMTTGLLFSATGGSQVIAELGGEMKHPTRDIPLVMIISTLGVGVLYAFMAIVAVGVLPLDAVANQPLTVVAHAIFDQPMYLFFTIGGGLFAIGTTLVALFSWVTKSFLAASEDGVLPRRLADVNKRFGTPHWLLLIVYLSGIIPVLLGVTLADIAKMGVGLAMVIYAFPAVALTQLPRKYPELYARARFKLSPKGYYALGAVAVTLFAVQSWLLIADLDVRYLMAMGVYVLLALGYAMAVGRTQAFRAKVFSPLTAEA